MTTVANAHTSARVRTTNTGRRELRSTREELLEVGV
jgi:hypothetical protein